MRPRLSATSSLCSRVRSPKAVCRRCLDCCPKSAIEIGREVFVGRICDACGICVGACPNGVFSLPGSDETTVAPPEGRESLRVACDMAAGIPDASLRVRCLGRFTENFFLAAAAAKYRVVRLFCGRCSECSRSAGIDVCRENVDRARALLDAVGVETEIGLDETPPVPHPVSVSAGAAQYTRRGIFSLFVGEMRNRFSTSGAGPENTRRGALLDLVQRLKPAAAVREAPGPDVFFDIRIGEHCFGCAVCESVCPVAAIERRESAGGVEMGFAPGRCTGCGVCRDACLVAAVTLQPTPIAEFLKKFPNRPPAGRPGFETRARVTLRACPLCGRMYAGVRECCLGCQASKARAGLSLPGTSQNRQAPKGAESPVLPV